MSRPDSRRDTVAEEETERTPAAVTRGLDALVPTALARRAVAVQVETDKDVYEPDESVDIRITIANRLPLPITVPLESQRIWWWAVDGCIEAIDEPLHVPNTPRPLSLRARETRSFDRRWDRRIKRDGDPPRWEAVSPGSYDVSAFVPTSPPRTDSTTVTLR